MTTEEAAQYILTLEIKENSVLFVDGRIDIEALASLPFHLPFRVPVIAVTVPEGSCVKDMISLVGGL